MHLDTILTLIGERETTAAATAGRLREQITLLSGELGRIDRELADLATTRSMLQHLAATEFTADDPTIVSSAYQQILAVLTTATAGMRAKDVCLALDIEPLPKNVEGTRAKLKRLVNREVVTEDKPGIFALIQKRT
ncbi:hypothetical protein [Actinoplanes sp. DH11]|uniref:hypothetical protein n=1 Tax=Actinoplanes sp. DH11 TaxID=2857011 RepID=UPI001E5FB8EF|nr:hypothetical protein [Actinoplanes sp. DH11]